MDGDGGGEKAIAMREWEVAWKEWIGKVLLEEETENGSVVYRRLNMFIQVQTEFSHDARPQHFLCTCVHLYALTPIECGDQ